MVALWLAHWTLEQVARLRELPKNPITLDQINMVISATFRPINCGYIYPKLDQRIKVI